jgi:hypothetical protein
VDTATCRDELACCRFGIHWGDSAGSTRSRATPLSISRKLLLLPVLIPRRDGPQRLVQGYIQVIDGLRNRASVGISHHVPGIIYEAQIRAADHFV